MSSSLDHSLDSPLDSSLDSYLDYSASFDSSLNSTASSTNLTPLPSPSTSSSSKISQINSNKKKRKILTPSSRFYNHNPLHPALLQPTNSTHYHSQPYPHPQNQIDSSQRISSNLTNQNLLNLSLKNLNQIFNFTPTDSISLSQVLSSHHVKTHKKPINSLRHYGRHLQKLQYSRSYRNLNQSISSSSDYSSKNIKPIINLTSKTYKSISSKKLSQSNKSKSRTLASPDLNQKSQPNLLKPQHQIIKIPILPNLYDPKLPIDHTYSNVLNPIQLQHARALITKSSSLSFHPELFSNHSFPWSHFRSHSLNQFDNSLQFHNHQATESFACAHNEFSFNLEIEEINQKLAGLHLAISLEKNKRENQIRDSMNIPINHSKEIENLSSSDNVSSTLNQSNLNWIEQSPNLSSPPLQPQTNTSMQLSSQKDPVSSLTSIQQRPGSLRERGPCGPPPSQPPPPVPNQTLSKSAEPLGRNSSENQTGTESKTKKNKKKGQQKRSAHANANNIHHRDNYVPSRLPSAYKANYSSLKQVIKPENRGRSTIELLSQEYELDHQSGDWRSKHGEYQFIDPNLNFNLDPDDSFQSNTTNETAMTSSTTTSTTTMTTASSINSESSFRRKSKNNSTRADGHSQLGGSAISRFFVEPDEWICSFCEYELWFGEEKNSLLRVIKDRKEVLKRKRRAKERLNAVMKSKGSQKIEGSENNQRDQVDEDQVPNLDENHNNTIKTVAKKKPPKKNR
ncbi:hypothetical protein O181_046011 [Austropuccinia psidii MF-1]|uniref:Uncharacterized protein n=1 Tax=Austropuccinia psidii MF-1 TaxID=1389203 RepID=A0A9Q3DL74_9BASI|nr:hypothetical protein [Austropuccinia psidii MF-1]